MTSDSALKTSRSQTMYTSSHAGYVSDDYKAFFAFVKAVAIIWIFSYHFFNFRFLMIPFGETFAKSIIDDFFVNASGPLNYLKGSFLLMFLHGHMGAELFFIASGFGLYLSHLKRQTTWRRFYTKRAIRIVPLYWFALVAVVLSGSSSFITTKSIVYHVFFLHVYTPNRLNFGPLWFMGALAMLYLLFPVFVKAFQRASTMWGLAVLSLFLTPMWSWLIDVSGIPYDGVTPTQYIPLFIVGMLLAHSQFYGTRLHRYVLLNPVTVTLSLVLFLALLVLSSYQLVPAVLAGKNFMALTAFVGLGAPFLVIRKMPAHRLIGFVSYSSYVVFLLQMTWIYLVATAIVKLDLAQYTLAINKGIYFLSGREMVFMGVFAFFSLLLVSFFMQWGYDMLTRRIMVPERQL